MDSNFDVLRGMRTGFGPFEPSVNFDNDIFGARGAGHTDGSWKPVATHRGELAGLTPEARAAAMERHEREAESGACDPLVELISFAAVDKPPVNTLSEILPLFKDEDLLDMAETLGLAGAEQLDNGALITALSKPWQSEEFLYDFVSASSIGALGTLSRVIKSPDLSIKIPFDRVWDFPVLKPLWPVMGLYKGDDAFTLSIPDELSDFFSSLAFSEWLDRRYLLQQRVEHLAHVLTTFCGVVSLEDFLARFEEMYGEPLSFASFKCAMGSYLDGMDDEGDFTVWCDVSKYKEGADDSELFPRGIYLVSGEYGSALYLEDHPNMSRADALKDRDDIVRGIIGFHKKYEYLGPCPIDPELSNVDFDVFDWQKSRPSAFNVLAWLDEHVPNEGAHDYTFAEDELLGLLLKEAQSPTFDEFEDAVLNDRTADLAEDLNPLLARLARLSDELPKWMFNGWAPVDNPALPHAHVQFVDADLNPISPERNAPCPCGSGKKYKKCCGR